MIVFIFLQGTHGLVNAFFKPTNKQPKHAGLLKFKFGIRNPESESEHQRGAFFEQDKDKGEFVLRWPPNIVLTPLVHFDK
jgi:hypothetical protein